MRQVDQSVQPSMPKLEAIAAAMLVALSSLIGLGLTADVPEVELSAIGFMDEGQEVVTRGLLADLRKFDSGFESMVIAAPDGQATLRVQVSQGLRPQPGAYARIGDILRVFGRVSNSGSEVTLYSDADAVFLEARSEKSLTVSTLCKTWRLFLGDELRLRGVVVRPLASEECRLYDAGFACSIALVGVQDLPGAAVALEAMVVGELGFDESSMSLVLEVVDVLPPD